MERLKDPKDAAKYRDLLLTSQQGIDPIIEKKIVDPCLDHQHFGTQQCRGVLQREVNSFEGKVQNAANRYLRHLTDEPLPVILRRLADYLERDYTNAPIHHTALTVDVGKFKRLSAQAQKDLLIAHGVSPDTNALLRAKQARKLIKSGILRMDKK